MDYFLDRSVKILETFISPLYFPPGHKMYIQFLLAGIVLVPTHILLSVCGDTETESDTFISKVIATIKQGQFGHNFKNAFLPNNQWGPCNIEEKKDWQIYCEEVDLYQWLPKIIRRKLRSQQSPAQVETPT